MDAFTITITIPATAATAAAKIANNTRKCHGLIAPTLTDRPTRYVRYVLKVSLAMSGGRQVPDRRSADVK
ncbi:hypothetical protein [Rhodococcus sp. O3]|uniref:hypothetical protein n=1 Tax=Rhodococcus sp. O3 TaxID=3404919 RepID=UPI003B67CA7B